MRMVKERTIEVKENTRRTILNHIETIVSTYKKLERIMNRFETSRSSEGNESLDRVVIELDSGAGIGFNYDFHGRKDGIGIGYYEDSGGKGYNIQIEPKNWQRPSFKREK